MLLFNGYKLNNFKIGYFFILVKVSFAGIFIDMKKLTLYDIYFVILDTGLYLYDFKSSEFSVLHEFNNHELRTYDNNINIKELNYRHRAYILCLVNQYLFLFNEYNYKVWNYKIKEIEPFKGYYYNIMPYKIENKNISFILAFNNNTTNLSFYFYNFNLTKSINEPKEIKFNNLNINNKMVRCQINSNSTFIICFYYTKLNTNNNLISTIFHIKNMDLIIMGKNSTYHATNIINEIKIATSYNDNFFVCFLNGVTPVCLINDDSYNFNKIDCDHGEAWSLEYKVLYFYESDDFMLISKYLLATTILNNKEKTMKICFKYIFGTQDNSYSLIYNNDTNNYQIVNYNNFKNYQKSSNISKSANIKHSNYIEETKYSLYNIEAKENLITNLNDFINYDINLDYIDDGEELIIQKDEMTITLTSTFIQDTKKNSNSTTINLGECEEKLRNIYNISNESSLYLLKIDTKQEGKNYPLIEYEVFYPLNNEKVEYLNLSFCNGMNIELSIPIILNDTIDKYNPKSNYYNNICTKATSKENTDIILNDRRNEFIYKNMSLCEENCELISYDKDNKKAKCSCNVKTTLFINNIELDKKHFLKEFIDIKKITNIEIIKCYRTCFKINNLKSNIGFFIIFFILILYFLCLNIFYCKSLNILIDETIKIINEINNKEYQITKNGQIYSFINNIRKKGNKKQTKSQIDSCTKFRKKEKALMIKKLKKKVNNKNIRKIKKITDKMKEKKEKNNHILEYTDSELDSLTYKNAIKKDKRTFCQYYWSLLKKKHSILFSFYPNKDYNSQIIKSFLFFFFYSSDIAVNSLFFTDDTMHKIYIDSGDFNLNYQLPQIVYSYLISSGINLIIEYLSLSEETIILIKSKINIHLNLEKKIIKKMKIKFCFFFIVSFLFLLIFGYYISCFCCIYENTQIHLIKDSLLSLGLSSIIPFFKNLIPGIFRIPALRDIKGNKMCMYKISQIIEFF